MSYQLLIHGSFLGFGQILVASGGVLIFLSNILKRINDLKSENRITLVLRLIASVLLMRTAIYSAMSISMIIVPDEYSIYGYGSISFLINTAGVGNAFYSVSTIVVNAIAIVMLILFSLSLIKNAKVCLIVAATSIAALVLLNFLSCYEISEAWNNKNGIFVMPSLLSLFAILSLISSIVLLVIYNSIRKRINSYL